MLTLDSTTEAITTNYGAVARSGLSSAHAGVKAIAEAFGYSDAELVSIPAEANMGLSCGNPTAMASLKPGEVVVDLGSGGGLDVFLAARKVGPTGKAIGIDMTQDMVDLARRNAAGSCDPDSAPVEFHLATIDRIPLSAESVDCVISNCVINLATDKPAVFREIFRILKPGGRLAISDIALKKPLPAELENDIAALVGCIGGALLVDDYRGGLAHAGFSAIDIVDSHADLNAYALVENQSGCCSPTMAPSDGLAVLETGCCSPSAASEPGVHERLAGLMRKYDINEFAASVKVLAVKAGHV
jgi:arsenite methyltransferase